jgi:hypothetical protein
MFVKPGPRQDDRDRPLVVRAPNGRLLSPLGEDVPETQFWIRRLRDKDVVTAEPNPTAPAVQQIIASREAIEDTAAAAEPSAHERETAP